LPCTRSYDVGSPVALAYVAREGADAVDGDGADDGADDGGRCLAMEDTRRRAASASIASCMPFADDRGNKLVRRGDGLMRESDAREGDVGG